MKISEAQAGIALNAERITLVDLLDTMGNAKPVVYVQYILASPHAPGSKEGFGCLTEDQYQGIYDHLYKCVKTRIQEISDYLAKMGLEVE